MRWPPRFWAGLKPDLPPNTDLHVFEAKVRAIAGVYLNKESDKAELYTEICERLCALDPKWLAGTLKKLPALPSQFQPQVDVLGELLRYSEQQVRVQKYAGARRNTVGRLYFNLLCVLRETGLPPADGDKGPTVRVFKAITDCLPIKPLSNRGIREIIRTFRRDGY